MSYPLGYERIAQLFDSPNAPDIVISPKSYAFGRQPGQHGALDVVQSRAPLVFSGPGVVSGETDVICSHVDVTPTLAKLLGFEDYGVREGGRADLLITDAIDGADLVASGPLARCVLVNGRVVAGTL